MANKKITIGTIGHSQHGKTSLACAMVLRAKVLNDRKNGNTEQSEKEFDYISEHWTDCINRGLNPFF